MPVRDLLSAASGASSPATYVEDVFSTYLYTGNGSTQTINNGIDLAGEGGLTWIKERDDNGAHFLFDTVRGATNALRTNTTGAQSTIGNSLTSFNSDGFSLGAYGDTNASSTASWTFRKAPKFFDVVTWTGDGNNGKVISHSLASKPGTIIIKRTDTNSNWFYATKFGASSYWYGYLDTFGGFDTAQGYGAGYRLFAEPTITQFSLADWSPVNAAGGTYVAYLFAHNAGGFGAAGTDNVISCGSFTTDGSGVATVNLGYEPQYLLVKDVTNARNWRVIDTMRGWVNDGTITTADDQLLRPNLSDAESNGGGGYPFATGFTYAEIGSSNYIYMAIRRPMKPPTSGTSVFSPVARTGTDAAATITGVGFAPDGMIYKARNVAIATSFQDRLRGGSPRLYTPSTAAESLDNELDFGSTMDGIKILTGDGVINNSAYTYINYLFRRATGFFDVVCYTGTGAAQTINHNLGVAPELMIVKRRSGTGLFATYLSSVGNTQYMGLNGTGIPTTSSEFWNNTTPTNSVFTVGINQSVNGSGSTYVAYLFATCAGVSKVGSYTGTGATQTINCGFTGGARFVLIKRTDSTGDWYVWDTSRGMVSGTDPSLLLNSTAAEVNANSVYTATTGFQIVSTAAGINASGGSYIYFSVA